jgi:hypothetical protein
MKPTECPHCHNTELVDGGIGQANVQFHISFFKGVLLEAVACLECGVVTPYLGSSELNKVRKWRAQVRPKKVIIDEL